MGDAGLEPAPLEHTKTAISRGSGAESGAPDAPTPPKQAKTDPSELPSDLVEIVAVWPELPEHIKAAIKALITTHTKGDQEWPS